MACPDVTSAATLTQANDEGIPIANPDANPDHDPNLTQCNDKPKLKRNPSPEPNITLTLTQADDKAILGRVLRDVRVKGRSVTPEA